MKSMQQGLVEYEPTYVNALMTNNLPSATVTGFPSTVDWLTAQKKSRLGQAGTRDTRRATRNAISPGEWAARRGEITELYRHRGWTLLRVMGEMAARGFVAS
jgi:hypothetical protein